MALLHTLLRRQTPIQYASVPQTCVEARNHCISRHADKRLKSHELGGDPRDTKKG